MVFATTVPSGSGHGLPLCSAIRKLQYYNNKLTGAWPCVLTIIPMVCATLGCRMNPGTCTLKRRIAWDGHYTIANYIRKIPNYVVNSRHKYADIGNAHKPRAVLRSVFHWWGALIRQIGAL